ncbi:MAG: hypothetical protein P1U90_06615 [Akkermansiaceae bacterium]|nr:hypothetical protein [Akkermansiaceae bacterium]
MKKKTSTTLLTSALFVFPSWAELVPGGDFEIFKPGTNYTVPATFVAGNSFARGVGDGIELAGGSVSYDDGSPDGINGDGIPDLDLPGWEPLQSGNDLVGNGFNGTTGMNLFAAWGGDGRIQTAGSLGTIQGGETITITVMVGGPDSGPIQGPLAFHLVADGVQLEPSASVDPTLPNGGAFQMISRTYDAAALAGSIGASTKIVLGVEDDNDFANRVIFDNVTIEGLSGPPADGELALSISPMSADPDLFDFAWNSKTGFVYDLVSSDDLTEPIENWTVWEGQSDIPGTGSEITISEVFSGDSKRFFAIVEKVSADAGG